MSFLSIFIIRPSDKRRRSETMGNLNEDSITAAVKEIALPGARRRFFRLPVPGHGT